MREVSRCIFSRLQPPLHHASLMKYSARFLGICRKLIPSHRGRLCTNVSPLRSSRLQPKYGLSILQPSMNFYRPKKPEPTRSSHRVRGKRKRHSPVLRGLGRFLCISCQLIVLETSARGQLLVRLRYTESTQFLNSYTKRLYTIASTSIYRPYPQWCSFTCSLVPQEHCLHHRRRKHFA